MVEAGIVRCTRCSELIKAGESWDLGHVDASDYKLYAGPEHRRCNRATARPAKERRMRWSRQW
jgi:hypothetical protein